MAITIWLPRAKRVSDITTTPDTSVLNHFLTSTLQIHWLDRPTAYDWGLHTGTITRVTALKHCLDTSETFSLISKGTCIQNNIGYIHSIKKYLCTLSHILDLEYY